MKQLLLIVIFAVGLASCRPNSSSRIIGGRIAVPGELPNQASLQFWGTTFHFAGGSLINARWVVTTAHGVFGLAGNSVNIILGITNLNSPFVNRRSSEIRIHPLYDKPTLLNDIATIRSSVAIIFDNFISPITLSPTFLELGTLTQISGWGATMQNKTAEATQLQVASVITQSCINSEFMTFTLQHVCAGINDSAIGICTNDVGGPMVLNNMLVGIPFFHDPRACATWQPDGYLRVSSYRTWIMGNTPL
ncbi:chymotrypsin-2-like [Chironomus tepperi]|uniref:chymotrypsin-2-like n=1 Tax=Chironomus tepperi TaxID=113505 RepID=UPI00391EE350